MKLSLPNLKLGVATAATQIEGGIVDNNWREFFLDGGINDNADPARANDHYARFKEDIDLMSDLKIQCYRMGVEWARIEPEEGKFDQAVIDHYIEEIDYLKSKNIEVMLTLHHFSNPMWFEKRGGWESVNSFGMFINFVRNFVPHVIDKVDYFITINEPNVYAYNCYFNGLWWPNIKNFGSLSSVYGNFTRAHIGCYNYLHSLREDVKVSFANHLRVFQPKKPKNPFNRATTRFAEKCFQGALTHAMMTGECRFPLPQLNTPVGKFYDYIGINYYTRSTMKGLTDVGSGSSCAKNDLGWDIFPEGLAILAKQMHEKYEAPVLITENGTADATDAFRAKYIYDHLEALVTSGVPVTHYFHWTFIDNWEWAEGESARFGLVANDFDTQQRTPRPSARFYTDIIENRGVTDEAYREYVEKE
jgi:beta-glucosidase